MSDLLTGAIAALSAVAALFFLRFWRDTRDRLFLWFSLSFAIEAANRVLLGVLAHASEQAPLFYGVRLLSYGLIVFAVLQKNKR